MDADFVFEVEELLFEFKVLCTDYERQNDPGIGALTEQLRREIAAAEDALYEEHADALESALTDIGQTLEALKKKTYGQ